MEFWGVEVKPGETVKVDPGDNKYLHLSQVALGETKKDKGNENVPVFVKFDNQKLVLGTLSQDKCAQIQYDLVFEKEFELSHSSKNASIYFAGYKTVAVEEEGDDEFPTFGEDESESDEDLQLDQKANGKPDVKNEQAKPIAGKPTVKAEAPVAKPKAKAEELSKPNEQKEDDDDSEEDDESEEDSEEDEFDEEDEVMAEGEDDSDEDEDESSDEDEATPKKAEPSNKRPSGSALKTPAEKKAKLVTPAGTQKTGGAAKKGGHTATPYPAKQGGKTSANNNDKSKQQTTKSSGGVMCNTCNRSFVSQNALESHTKAKHAAAK